MIGLEKLAEGLIVPSLSPWVLERIAGPAGGFFAKYHADEWMT